MAAFCRTIEKPIVDTITDRCLGLFTFVTSPKGFMAHKYTLSPAAAAAIMALEIINAT
jgi:hypothetical protein